MRLANTAAAMLVRGCHVGGFRSSCTNVPVCTAGNTGIEFQNLTEGSTRVDRHSLAAWNYHDSGIWVLENLSTCCLTFKIGGNVRASTHDDAIFERLVDSVRLISSD